MDGPYRIILTPQAVDDIDDIRAWYGQGGPKAKQRVERILAALRALAENAYRWPADDRDPAYRMRVVEGHRIRFEIDGARNALIIHRIRGPWQDLP